MQQRIFAIPLLVALLLAAVLASGMQCVLGTATNVVDGDTFDVVANLPVGYGEDCPVVAGQQYRVRLIGVDTPEVHGATECYGPEASAYTKQVLEGRGVCLLRDVSCTDRYDRLLAYVWVDTDPSQPGCETFLNSELAMQGYGNAMPYPPDTTLQFLIQAAECDAYKAGRGMWSACPGLPAPADCGAPPAQPTPATGDPCGPCAASDCNCGDFSSWQQAKACLDAHPGDPFELDNDGDGSPCESLPGAP